MMIDAIIYQDIAISDKSAPRRRARGAGPHAALTAITRRFAHGRDEEKCQRYIYIYTPAQDCF